MDPSALFAKLSNGVIGSFAGALQLSALILLTSTLASCQATTSGTPNSQQDSADGFYDLTTKRPIVLKIKKQEIQPQRSVADIPMAPVEKYEGTQRKCVNASLNSRVAVDIPQGEWKVLWKSKIPQSNFPKAVLVAGDRVVLEGTGHWILFDVDGKVISQGRNGASGIFIDGSQMYSADATGLIRAKRLVDGANAMAFSLFFGDAYARSFLYRNASRFLAVSHLRERDRHDRNRETESTIEHVELGQPEQLDRDGMLRSAKYLRHFARKDRSILAAAGEKHYVIAANDRIYRLDKELNVTQALSERFKPIALSLDQAERAYLIVEKEAKRFLWIVQTDGSLALEFQLPEAFRAASNPPIIGYDHSVFVFAGKELLAVDYRGKVRWQQQFPAEIAGAVVTPKSGLIIAAGSELVRINDTGERFVLIDLKTEQILTAPSFTSDGDLFIATSSNLYRFGSVPK